MLYCGKTQINYVILAKSSPQCENVSTLTDVDNGNNYYVMIVTRTNSDILESL